MRALLFVATLVLAGCGYVGDPQPPALRIPTTVSDLSAFQRGDKLRLSFSLPKLTTEGLVIANQGEMDVRVGLIPDGGFNIDAWTAAAKRVPASATEQSPTGQLSVEAAVSEFAGKEIAAAVRTANDKGRWSAWSNIVTATIVKPLLKPAAIRTVAVAEGVRLDWKSDAPQFRVFRRADKEETFNLLGQVTGSIFTDRTAEFGNIYHYRIQAFSPTGALEAESEISDTVAFTPKDTFPPAPPVGIAALAGVGSIEIAWERNLEKDLGGYRIYRATADGPFAPLSELIESPSFSDKTAETGKTYRYAVSALDRLGNESAKSQETRITVQ